MRTLLATVAIGALLSAGGTACRDAEARTSKVGDKLKAFIVQNCDSEAKYCQVCKYGGQPTIMAVGQIGDEAFEQDLVRIQDLLSKQKDGGLTAFALLGKLGPEGLAHFEDEAKALAELKAMRARLGLSYPVVIAPKERTKDQARSYQTFNQAYSVTKGRTILFAGANNELVFAETIAPASADAQFKTLEAKVTSAL